MPSPAPLTLHPAPSDEADLYMSFLSGMVAAYTLDDDMLLHPIVEYGACDSPAL